MTSKLTRERLEKIKSWRETYGTGSNVMLPAEEAEELACLALAAMDSEPVAYIDKQWTLVYYVPPMSMGLKIGDKLYRHAQPAPVTEREPIAWLNDAYLARGVVDGEAGSEDAGPGYIPVYREAQPAPTVPDAYVRDEHGRMMLNGVCEPKIGFGTGWNACRAAMLKAQPQNAPQNIPEIIPGWIPVSERMPEAEGHYLVWANASRIDGNCDHLAIATYQGGEWSNEFNWLVTHWMPLPAAPQEVK
ncbi:TPA: DUF551 domain-containing protein [Klebsiella pneumoniae]